MIDGAFYQSLKRNNKQIRDDRAMAIAEDTQLVYKRKIEDYELEIKRLQRQLDSMLDLSPTNTQSLSIAKDFDCNQFVSEEMSIGLKIRETEIKLEIARRRYNTLFGDFAGTQPVPTGAGPSTPAGAIPAHQAAAGGAQPQTTGGD